ncbi:unnamed protein product [Prorocentrum cordatum]|uniref:Subtilisin n=1 Tax=Prorocentrum cordatum TaxID=2364126 RepID=A0ABN9TMX0_9DINO|nr:unnamed protein product [Polarella glacialis]
MMRVSILNKAVAMALWPWKLVCSGSSDNGTSLLDGGMDEEDGLLQAATYDIDAKVLPSPSSYPAACGKFCQHASAALLCGNAQTALAYLLSLVGARTTFKL